MIYKAYALICLQKRAIIQNNSLIPIKGGERVKTKYSSRFWICLVFGILSFAFTFPFYHGLYVSRVHTLICIALNAFSSIIFSIVFYSHKRIDRKKKPLLLFAILLQGIGHGIFRVMNWGSFFFLALSPVAIFLLLRSVLKRN